MAGMCEYELKRLERIKSNRKMLKELFPEGTGMYTPCTAKANGRRDSVQGSQSGSAPEESTSEKDATPKKKYTVRTMEVYPRRNPSRKARPAHSVDQGLQRMTRSMSKVQNVVLLEGVEDEQKIKRLVYKTIRTRNISEEDELPIEIDNITYNGQSIRTVKRSTDKVYDRVRGTTCHQCRQKTLDTKTICHNKNCKGVRGQFCGPCLLNRYGEDLCEAIWNEKWVCPPCRKICNCSFCMPKRGKAPTGIMIHLARDAGFNNVHEYLDKQDYD